MWFDTRQQLAKLNLDHSFSNFLKRWPT